MEKKVRTRIAPSPTGDPHVGTAYIALFNLAFANSNNGEFILRIEDTDQNRYTEGSEQMIFDALHWLGLNYAEGPDVGGEYGPYRQSERFHLYGDYAKKLVEQGGAYYCFCTQDRLDKLRERQKAMGKAPGYDGHCRSLTPEEIQAKLDAGEPYVIRLKMPYEGETIIHDRLRGDIVFENNKIDDQVLLKADGFPTYHLANVVDDHLMGITHVIRAEEWIASTPKHIQLYKAFGWEQPEFIHMPLLRNADRTKISKRKNPVSLIWYKEEGYLKEGIVNFLGLMGYSFGENKEIFSLQEFVDNFNIDKVSLGGPVF
ncbi:MAG: glutamate--tRNA ligase, partial [Fusobacterium mortiferum]